MALEVRHDFLNNEYIQGDVDGHHVYLERGKDSLICGNSVWGGNIDGHDVVVKKGKDHLIGGKSVIDVNISPDAQASGAGGVVLLILGLILIPITIYLPLLVWKLLYAENIPELMAVAIGSVGVIAFYILRKPADFSDALGCSIIGISCLFFLMSSLLTFVIKTPAMTAEFNIGNLLGIGLISFLVSLAPAVIIAILSAIASKIKK